MSISRQSLSFQARVLCLQTKLHDKFEIDIHVIYKDKFNRDLLWALAFLAR